MTVSSFKKVDSYPTGCLLEKLATLRLYPTVCFNEVSKCASLPNHFDIRALQFRNDGFAFDIGSYDWWFLCLVVLMLGGSYAWWFLCLVVLILGGSYTWCFLYLVVLILGGSYARWFLCFVVLMLGGFFVLGGFLCLVVFCAWWFFVLGGFLCLMIFMLRGSHVW